MSSGERKSFIIGWAGIGVKGLSSWDEEGVVSYRCEAPATVRVYFTFLKAADVFIKNIKGLLGMRHSEVKEADKVGFRGLLHVCG
jgi:hypothetical protein